MQASVLLEGQIPEAKIDRDHGDDSKVTRLDQADG